MHRAAALAVFVFASTAFAQCDPSTIYPQSNPSLGLSDLPRSVAIGDLNGDGAVDLATVNSSINDASILFGNGDGTFQSEQLVGLTGESIAIDDLNGDGNLDIVAVGEQIFMPVGSVLLGNGDGTFQGVISLSVGQRPEFVAIGDLDGDGAPDLAVANRNDDDLSVLLGNGDGTFQTRQDYGTGVEPTSIAIGDLNSDGVPDLAVGNQSSDDLSLLFGNGDGTFQTELRVDVGNGESVKIGDLNGDGLSDIVTTGSGLSVLIRNVNGTFQPEQQYGAGDQPNSFVIADLNGDGVPDLASANFLSDDVSVLFGNGDGTFQSESRFEAGDGPISVAAEDLDMDGGLDLVVANFVGGNLSLLLNTCGIPPALSMQPAETTLLDAGGQFALSVDVGSGAPPVTFQWRKNGEALVDDSRIVGSQTDTLTITNANGNDTDTYDVVVTNDFGLASSDDALVAVRPSDCAGDTDGSGAVNFGDLVSTLFLFGDCE